MCLLPRALPAHAGGAVPALWGVCEPRRLHRRGGRDEKPRPASGTMGTRCGSPPSDSLSSSRSSSRRTRERTSCDPGRTRSPAPSRATRTNDASARPARPRIDIQRIAARRRSARATRWRARPRGLRRGPRSGAASVPATEARRRDADRRRTDDERPRRWRSPTRPRRAEVAARSPTSPVGRLRTRWARSASSAGSSSEADADTRARDAPQRAEASAKNGARVRGTKSSRKRGGPSGAVRASPASRCR